MDTVHVYTILAIACCPFTPVLVKSQTTVQVSTLALPDNNGTATEQPASSTAPVTPLYIGGFFALPGGGLDASDALVGVEMALEHINSGLNVLAGYELRMVWNDSKCDAGLGTRLFFDQIRLPPQKLMLIGPACSTTAQAVAQTSFYWNLITMSYSAGSSALSNRVVFPYFYRTYMPDAMLNRARIRLIKEFGWQRVATIHENQDLFSLAINDMINLLKAENITLISSESFDEDPTNQVANLKALDARIIIVNMYESKARRVMCEAARQGMTGPGYVWFLLGWLSYNWWKLDDPTVKKCTTAEYKSAVESSYYIGFETVLFGDDDAVTVSGITPLEFDNEVRRRLALPENSGYTYNGIASFGYDAAWAIALALNESAEILKTKTFEDGSTRRLEDFTYDDKEMSQVFFDSLDRINFYGTSGPVSFLGADRISFTKIEQLKVGCWPNWIEHRGRCYMFVGDPASREDAVAYCRANDNSQLASVDVDNDTEIDFLFQALREAKVNDTTENNKWLIDTVGDMDFNSTNATCSALDIAGDVGLIAQISCLPLPFICEDEAEYTEVNIGTYDTANDVLRMTSEIIWPGGEVPPDRTPVIRIDRVEEYVGIDFIVFVSLASLAGIGILLSLFFLAFNIRYRALRIVRMSSPNLNNIILIGTVIVYASVVLYGIDTNLVAEKHLVLFCHIRVWFLVVGFVLAFGAMFSKTWRVHKVVARKTPKRKVVQDRQLILMVAALLLIDVVILVPWQLIFPWHVDKIYLPEKQDTENATLILVPYITMCTGEYYLYWTIGVCSFKGLLLIFGAFLAWETRQVTIPALNDSKLIGISVYNVVILCIVGLAINLVLGRDPQTLFIFNSGITIFCTTLAILIVFLPKVLAVRKNPMEDPMRESTTRTMTRNSNDSMNNNREMIQENRALKEKVAQLQKQLKESQEIKGNDNHLPSGPTHSQIRTRACNLGVWCCGLICGCSPGEVDQPAASYREDETVQSAHINEVDLSLEMATSTTVGTPISNDPNHAIQSNE
ncbi:uncharacterized protein LOC119741448 isoform X2 [Patiria miniata]|uniref:Gamma-aminobutyric acid type B receptor subunit 2 n=1 Tax=Patiria miniata TaxID=46514 RepID=A0A914BAA3_PATMI|nr:uncharacterized protein LOC119741448 isoform X2 [Patiria miniata]